MQHACNTKELKLFNNKGSLMIELVRRNLYKRIAVLFTLSSVAFADSSIVISPVLMSIMPNKNSLTFEYTLKEAKPIRFNGSVYGSTNISAASESKREDFGGMYVVSSWNDGIRYGLALYQSPNGTHNTYTNATAMTSVKEYETNYINLSLMACKAINSNLFIAVALNFTEEKATKELTAPTYYAKLKGTGVAPWGALGVLYMPTYYSGIFANITTKINLNIKGNIDGKTPTYTASSSGNVDVIFPPEFTIGGFMQFSETSGVSLGVKKVFWSQRKTEDIQIKDAMIEEYFGIPESNAWHDIYMGYVALNHSLSVGKMQVGCTLFSGANDAGSAYLTTASFGGKSVFVSFDTKLTNAINGGVMLTRTYLNGGAIDNETLKGSIDGRTRDTLSVFTKYDW